MFRTLVFAVAATLLVFYGVGLLLADHWDVDSERTVAAPPARVAPLLGDFATWQDWSGMRVELGAGMTREVSGEPGHAGHQIAWRGAQGAAILRLVEVGPGAIDYELLSQRAGDPDEAVVGRGRIRWQAEGDGTRVSWHDEGQADAIVLRWIAWFGAMQEQVRQIQTVSLAGLQKAVEAG
ncbi:MAG: SRPBCC family protein [Planctomycetes bacterium]|nr:SRPBCC family protein [Planctomycetota bacterium]